MYAVAFVDLDHLPVDERVLSREEIDRVRRKATVSLRQRQAASFQFLRTTLAPVVGVPPESLKILTAAGGKPFLDPGQSGGNLYFNVSHSQGVGMVAWAGREVGCDVEHLIPRPTDGLAGEILSPREWALWQRESTEGRQAWLTRCWVRKESTLKAAGAGLRIPPRTVDVDGGPSEPGGWQATIDGRRWVGRDCIGNVPDGYRAAVCIEQAAGDG